MGCDNPTPEECSEAMNVLQKKMTEELEQCRAEVLDKGTPQVAPNPTIQVDNTAAEALKKAQTEIAALKEEIQQLKASGDVSALKNKIEALETENQKLKETAQFYFDKGVNFTTDKDYEGAKNAFETILKRFPNDPLSDEASAQLKGLGNAKLGDYLAGVDDTLSLEDKYSYETARDKLSESIDTCKKCKNARDAKKKLKAIKKTLSDWPIEVDDVEKLELRYGDLKGKTLTMSSAYFEASTYYNCKYRSSSKWRSFKMKSSSEIFASSISAYCKKGVDFCEELFEESMGSETYASGVILKYPQRNSICEEGQIEIIGIED